MNQISPSLARLLQLQQAQIDSRAPYQQAVAKKPDEPEAYRGRTWTDPLAVNRNPVMGAMFNPFGESFKAKSPAPMLDPIGYAGGMYKPGTQAGNLMNKINDPFKLFNGGFRGLLG